MEDDSYPPSRLFGLIERFPEGSNFHTAFTGYAPDARDWTLTAQLIAALVNAVNLNTVATIKVTGNKPPKIEPLTGPVPIAQKKKRPTSIRELHAAFTSSSF